MIGSPYKVNLGLTSSEDFDQFDPTMPRPDGSGLLGWWKGKPGRIRPRSINERLLIIDPDGEVPLTAMSSLMKKEIITDPERRWSTLMFPPQAGFILSVGTYNGIYTNVAMTGADFYNPTSIIPSTVVAPAETVLFLKIAEDTAQQIRPGHVITFLTDPVGNPYGDIADPYIDINAKVLAVNKNGDDSWLQVKLLCPDVVTESGHTIKHANRILVTGNVNEEGTGWPSSLTYAWKEMRNWTQIFKTPIEITGTALSTDIKYFKSVLEQHRMMMLYDWARENEKAMIFGRKSFLVGEGGKPERTMDGIKELIVRGGGIVEDFRSAIPPAGITYASGVGSWLASGEDWLNVLTMKASMYKGRGLNPGSEYLAFCGHAVPLHINRLIRNGTSYTITGGETEFGLTVQTWQTPYMRFHLKTHPLFHEPALHNSMLVFAPSDVVRCPLRNRDSKHLTDRAEKYNDVSSFDFIDGIKEGYLAEYTIEYHFPCRGMWVHGIGLDRP